MISTWNEGGAGDPSTAQQPGGSGARQPFAPVSYDQGVHPESGVAVGGWVPFANYLNTQSNQGAKVAQPPRSVPGLPPAPKDDPGADQRAPGQGQPDAGNGLAAGPGLGGYYGQLSQQYLTGKRQ